MSFSKRAKTKTEHSGAKNGGGFWGPRKEAKDVSKKHRRSNDKILLQEEKGKIQKVNSDLRPNKKT